MNKKTVMIDMDDVMVSGGLLKLINKFLNTNYVESDFKDFYMQDIIPKERKREFFDYFFRNNVYDYCNINPNAIEVIEKLTKKYDVYIGTSYIFKEYPKECSIILKNKFEFLIKYFPFLNPYNFIFVGNKSVINCDIRIDDRLDNVVAASTKILYSAYHNKDLSEEYLTDLGVKRANNWLDIEKILLDE